MAIAKESYRIKNPRVSVVRTVKHPMTQWKWVQQPRLKETETGKKSNFCRRAEWLRI